MIIPIAEKYIGNRNSHSLLIGIKKNTTDTLKDSFTIYYKIKHTLNI